MALSSKLLLGQIANFPLREREREFIAAYIMVVASSVLAKPFMVSHLTLIPH